MNSLTHSVTSVVTSNLTFNQPSSCECGGLYNHTHESNKYYNVITHTCVVCHDMYETLIDHEE